MRIAPGIEQRLYADPEFQAGMYEIARDARRHVEMAALRFRRTGYFARSLRTGKREETWALISTDFAAWIIEYGSKNNPPYAPFRRGLRAAGLDFEEHSTDLIGRLENLGA